MAVNGDHCVVLFIFCRIQYNLKLVKVSYPYTYLHSGL